MTRCIHCTRCVRFGQEIAGVMELGMIGRGEHAEIVTFVGETVDSELSGNMIDLCPVGALTSKPFRYTARTWELSRRKIGVAARRARQQSHRAGQERPRDARPAARERAVNECWLSDKDRFSYEALNSPERLTAPMMQQGGEVEDGRLADGARVRRRRALPQSRDSTVGRASARWCRRIRRSRSCTCARKLMRGLGSDNIDFRLRQTDFRGDGARGDSLARHADRRARALDRVLVVGSFLRKDHPLLAQRLRQAAKKGAQISLLHSATTTG